MIELFNMDCMEYMKGCEDNAFELAIVDPPYGIGDFRGSKSKHKKIDWNNDIPQKKYFDELIRVSKNRIVWGANYYWKYLPDVGVIVHDKTGGGKRKQPKELSTCDIASHSFGVNMKVFHYLWCGNVSEKGVDWKNLNRIHPCQKPVALYNWLLQNYAKEGDRILDTHLGSGSSAIAAHYAGHDFVGCELDEDYFKAAQNRIDEETKQAALF